MNFTLDSLPIEVLQLIFDHLSFRDLIKCRSVSKLFELVCDLIIVKAAIINDRFEGRSYWFPNRRLIDYKDAVDFKTFHLYKSAFKLEKNIVRLHINQSERLNIAQFISAFQRLEVLDIECGLHGSPDQVLSLANLKVLRVGCSSYYTENRTKLILQTPKLETLKIASLNLVSMSNWNSIKHVEINLYEKKVELFENLESLRVNRVSNLNKHVLTVFRNLQRFEIFEIKSSCFFHHGEHHPIALRDLIVYILQQRIALKRFDFTIYLQGVQMLDVDVVKEYDLRKIGYLDFQMNNYNLLGDYLNEDEIDYSKLVKLVDSTPDDFFIKFFNIHNVQVNSAINDHQEHFIWFLTKLNFLDSLTLRDSMLNQSFYDQLSRSIPQLTIIKVFDSTKSNIRFDFVLKMKKLKIMEIDQNFSNPFDLAIKCFKKLNGLFLFSFTNQYGKHIRIQKIRTESNSSTRIGTRKRPNYDLKNFEFEIILSGRNMKRTKSGFDFNTLVTLCGYLKDTNGIMTRNKSKIVRSQLHSFEPKCPPLN